MLLDAIGTIKYYDEEHKVNLVLDDDLIDFYRSLVPKYLGKLNKPKHSGHVTLVRNEKIINKSFWKCYDNKIIRFTQKIRLFVLFRKGKKFSIISNERIKLI